MYMSHFFAYMVNGIPYYQLKWLTMTLVATLFIASVTSGFPCDAQLDAGLSSAHKTFAKHRMGERGLRLTIHRRVHIMHIPK